MQMQQEAGLTSAASGSFLTEAQRTALDAALAEKAAENAAKAREHAHHHGKGAAHERKSRNTKGTGAAKKSGAGGKFTWGSILTDGDKVERVLDRNDPNYDSDEERTVVMQSQHKQLKEEVQAYKQEVASIVEEYFSSGDIADVAESMEDLGVPGYMHYFVKRLVTCALDRNNREREMASVLLSSLYDNVIPPEQVQKGFLSLIDSIGDLVLDVPEAPELLSLFIVRAVVDDVLPPAIAQRIPDNPAASAALKQRVDAQLSARHGAEKVLRCWGGAGAGITWQDTKDSIARLLSEFVDSRDEEEAARCLHSLNVPFFHHEVVKQAVHGAMEVVQANPSQAQALIGLITRLGQRGEVSAAQVRKGLDRVANTLDDLSLDNPAAREQNAAVMQMAKSAGLLDLDEDLGTRGEGVVLRRAGSGNSVASTAGTTAAVSMNGSHALHSVAAFKAASFAAVQEYFNSGDAEEVARRLAELDDPGLLHMFIKVAVVAALDRRDREREMASSLLAQLSPQVFSPEIAAAGFTRLLGAADDLVLDCPDATHLLALFLGRAVVDEVLPPAFLAQVLKGLRSESLGVSVVRSAGALLSARHGAERLTNAWHGGAMTIDQIRAAMVALLSEYATQVGARTATSHSGEGGAAAAKPPAAAGATTAAAASSAAAAAPSSSASSSNDAAVREAARCLSELGVPAYHHQAVVAALEMAFAANDEKTESAVIALLAHLSATAVISQTQMTKGFSRVRAALGEEVVDYGPHTQQVYDRISAAAQAQGWLLPAEQQQQQQQAAPATA